MSKSEVYSWRLTSELKHLLETRARSESVSVAELLERIAREWLERNRDRADAQEQRRRHAAASRSFGSIAGGDPTRSRRVREIVRDRLATRHRVRSS